MGNRDRYDNQRGYDRPDRDRRDEGMLERIKNDVKAWFDDDDDERRSRSGRKHSGHRDYDYEGNDHRRNLQKHEDTWRGSRRYGGDRSYGDRGSSAPENDDRYGAAGSARRNRDFGSEDHGDQSYGSQDYRAPSYGSQDYGDRYAATGVGNPDQDDDDFGGQYGRSRVQRPKVLSAEYWATPGPHAGIGPKGFKRSPDHLKERVCERLESAGYIDASDIEVNVENEEVTLTGSVTDREQKRLAEDCAESVHGVSDVHNRLTIRRASDAADREQSGSRPDRSAGGNPGKSSTKPV